MSLGSAKPAATCMALKMPAATAHPAQQPVNSVLTEFIITLSSAGLISRKASMLPFS
jgi:hypothetical protein